MKKFIFGLAGLIAVAGGCAGDNATNVSTGNAALGIATFEVDDAADKTEVIGLDARGVEVARLDLVHGRFRISAMFADDFPGLTYVEGRKLDVSLRGTTHLAFEVGGYDPVLHLPAHPSSERELALFLDDPHVKAVLERWQLGWDAPSVVDGPTGLEASFVAGALYGTAPYACSSPATNCGSTSRGAMNTCGGGMSAILAERVTSPNEYRIAQCCPAKSGGQSNPWFATKACDKSTTPTVCDAAGGTSTTDGVMTTCGCQTATVGCKACPGYPASSGATCGISYDQSEAAIDWCYNEPMYTASVGVNPAGAAQLATNIPGFTSGSISACNGSTLSVSVDSQNPALNFTGFGGSCIGTSCTVGVTGNRSVTANFVSLAGSYTTDISGQSGVLASDGETNIAGLWNQYPNEGVYIWLPDDPDNYTANGGWGTFISQSGYVYTQANGGSMVAITHTPTGITSYVTLEAQ